MVQQFLVFGPVPSRRLGRSLGVNNIPSKHCSYGCVYCQLGFTTKKSITRRQFYKPDSILNEVRKKIEELQKKNEKIDYITFVPDGEPTLDINLGKEIRILKEFGISIAVITNSSLLMHNGVREDLKEADLVSIKVDAISEHIWKKIDRPSGFLIIEEVLNGIKKFSSEFEGQIISETMIIDNIAYQHEFSKLAEFLSTISIDKAYIGVPTRPPAESWANVPSEHIINQAYQEFAKILGDENVEYLIGYEGDSFYATGDIERDILSITSVHPMRRQAVEELLSKSGADPEIITELLKQGKLIELTYDNDFYYMRKLPSRKIM
ncbi:MAG: radical SAM protein [Candidatus Hodarchaeales archaeon]